MFYELLLIATCYSTLLGKVAAARFLPTSCYVSHCEYLQLAGSLADARLTSDALIQCYEN